MASKAIGFLNFKFGADLTAFERAMNKAQKKLKKFGNQLQKTGKNMTMGLTLPIVGVGVASAKMSMNFDKSMTKIITLVGIAEDEVNSMRKSVLLLSDKTGIAAAEMAEGLFFLTSAGLRGANALETLEAVAMGSASGLGDMESLSKVAAAAQNAYGVETLTAADALDTFGGMVQSGMFEANELSQVLGSQMGLASSLGINMEELGAFIATYTKTTGDATSATVGLEGVMMSFAKITPKQEKALGKINMTVEQLRDSLSEQGLQKTLIMMASKFKNAGVDLSEFFSKSSSLKGVLGVLGNQTETYIDILDDLSNKQGFVDEAFDRTSQMAGFQMTQSFNQLKNAGIEMGDALAPIILIIAEKIQLLSEWFSGLSKEQKNNVVKWGLVLAAIGPVLIIIGKISTGIGSLIGAFKGLSKFILANPYIALAAGIALVVAQVVKLISEYDGLTTTQRALNSINETAEMQTMSQQVEVGRLTDILKDENSTLEDKELALRKLNEIAPQYYSHIDAAAVDVKSLNSATKDYIDTLLTQARVQAAQETLVELMKEQIALDKEYKAATSKKAGLKYITSMIAPLQGIAIGEGGDLFTTLNRLNTILPDIAAVTDIVNTGQSKLDKTQKELNKTSEETVAVTEDKIEANQGLLSEIDSLQKQLFVLRNTEIDDGELESSVGKITKGIKFLRDTLYSIGKIDPNLQQWSAIEDQFKGIVSWEEQQWSAIEDQFKGIVSWTIKVSDAQLMLNKGAQLFGDILGSSLNSAIENQENFFQVFADNIKKVIRQLLIQLAIMTMIDVLLGGKNLSKALLQGNAMKVLGLQDGGLVTGPTTALIGEGSGTSISNPEVVAPLDRLKSMMGGSQNIIVEGRLVGNDIYLSNERTKFNRNRTV